MKVPVYCDYTTKIKSKIFPLSNEANSANDINNLIIWLNYCFLNHNNFFIENFNRRVIKIVSSTYNHLKTNILTENVIDLFDGISLDGIRAIKFILIQSINNYQIISQNNNELCLKVSEDSLKHLLAIISKVLNSMTQK